MKVSKFHFNRLPILKSLPENEVKWLRANSKVRKVKAKHELFREGSLPNTVYILKKGKIKIFQTTINGNEQIVYIYMNPETFLGIVHCYATSVTP